MVTVYFVRNGSKIRVEVPEGTTLMEAAKFFANESIEEIPATCGGACACGTCHIHLSDEWVGTLGYISEESPELDLLEYEKNYIDGRSRLACQITLTSKHNGMIVHLLDNELL
jgi:2Fe-2S ferredoxin